MEKFLSTREIQLEEKKILDEVVKFLNENDIRYFLCGGTLLGAIRHKGFIPWDDDIDIAIPRPDYNRLQEVLKKKNVLGNNLFFHSMELKNLNMPFTKVYNHDIEINDWRYEDKYEKYLWIDIFPFDGFPESKEECEKWFNRRNLIKKGLGRRKMSNKFLMESKDNKSRFISIIKICLKYLYKLLPERMFSKMIVSLTKKYSYDESKNVGCFVWGYGPRESMPKDVCETYIDVEFEGNKYKGLKEYDLYLSSIYGDYMQLPPEEKRVTHSFKAWRVNNEKNKK